MTAKQPYDFMRALRAVHRRANRLSDDRRAKMRDRYVKAVEAPIFGWLLGYAERRAWAAAVASGRVRLTKSQLRQLAEVSNAARNAGLAVLVRDLIPDGWFKRLTRIWRRSGLPLPAAAKYRI